MILLALICRLFNRLLLIPDSLPVVHQARISQSHVVIDLTFKFVVRAGTLLVFLFSDMIVCEGLLVLAQVVIALTTMHVEKSQSTLVFHSELLLRLRVTCGAACFIEDCRTEIV